MAAKKSPAHIAKQAERCYELSLAGLSTRAIAEEMGISQPVVVRRMAHYISNRTHRKADEWRDRQLDDLMNLRAKLQKQIESGDPKAIAAAVRIWERISKIGGLDAATLFKVDMEANVSRESDANEAQRLMDQFFGRVSSDEPGEPKVIPHIDVTQRPRRPVPQWYQDKERKQAEARERAKNSTPDEFAAEPDANANAAPDVPEGFEDLGTPEPAPRPRRKRGQPIPNPAAQFLRDSDDD